MPEIRRTAKKEHDMRTLKRQAPAALRFGTPTGTRVILVWDKAGIDFAWWLKCKNHHGIYFISRPKDNMVFENGPACVYDAADPVNAGILADELVAPATHMRYVRRIKLLAAVESRIAWPGKPGAPVQPEIVPLTPEQTALAGKGRVIYGTLCAACHQPHGFGLDGLAPPLVDSEWVLGQPDIPARIILHGIAGAVKVGPRTWNLAMPPLPHLTDEEIAGTLTFLRREWDHTAPPVAPADITAVRARFKDRALPWTAAEMKGRKK